MPYISREFNIPSGPQQVLASSLFLLGFVFGPLVFAPLSEEYGRKPILLIGSIGFAAWNMGSALSPNWMALLVFRFLAGTFGAPPLSVVGGILADIYPDKMKRGRLLGVWSLTILLGPLLGPLVSGFIGPHGWRWPFW